MANIVTRLIVKPQLARKRQSIQVPAIVRLPQAPKPATQRPKQLQIPAKPVITALPQRPVAPPLKPPPPKPNQPRLSRQEIASLATPPRHGLQAVTQRPRALRRQEGRKNSGVRYITPDISSSDHQKIKNVRGRGAGKLLVIVGNGPSLSEAPLEMLRGHPYVDMMSINKPDDRLWPTAYWAFFDQSQLRRHSQLWDSYDGIVFNSTSIKQMRPNTVRIKNLGTFGFSLDLMHGLNIGRSSVYAAMQIALWLDYRHVYIFGCDMSEVNGKTHFYGVNPDVTPQARLDRFAKEAEYYTDAATRLDDAVRQRFTFCSTYNPYDFVEKFGRMDQLEAVPLILERARSLYQ